jgi:nucleoside-diphosphate-sugar epimerase
MKVDIVGGSGFIGSRLTRRMTQRGEFLVRIIDKVPSRAFPASSVVADVRSLEDLRASLSEGSILINLAAEHRDDVRPISLYQEVNVNGSRNLCTVAREKNIKTIVFTSSVAVYGFAPVGTGEDGSIAPFNDYGRTKYEAEEIFREWQREAPETRTLAIVRPTVVFGEQNRGNVYNLLRQIASGRFLMIGSGTNRKSIAYVENVAAFIEMASGLAPGIHTTNYVDQPDFDMNALVALVYRSLGKRGIIRIRLPYWLGIGLGRIFDLVAAVSGRKFPISAIRVQKFCANSVYASAVPKTGFVPPVHLMEALDRTVRHEFVDTHADDIVYYSE